MRKSFWGLAIIVVLGMGLLSGCGNKEAEKQNPIPETEFAVDSVTKSETQTTEVSVTNGMSDNTTSDNTMTSNSIGTSSAANSEAELVQNIISQIITNDMSELEKVKAIHDYMVMNIDYDTVNYYKNTVPDTSRTVEGTLTTKYAVCEGYAVTFKALCEAAGLEAVCVSGVATNSREKTEAHAWNQVKINQKWYNVDVTWDDPGKGSAGIFEDHTDCHYDYFLSSDEIMYKDHVAEDAKQVCAESLYMDVIQMGCPWYGFRYVTTMDEIYAAIEDGVNQNASKFVFLMDENMISIDELQREVDRAIERCNVKKDYIKHGSESRPTNAFGLTQVSYLYELNNGIYTKVEPLTTAEQIKEELREASKNLSADTDVEHCEIYITEELWENTSLRDNIIAWAEAELDVFLTWGSRGYDSPSIAILAPSLYKINHVNDYGQVEEHIIRTVEIVESKFMYQTRLYVELNYENLSLKNMNNPFEEIQFEFVDVISEKYGVHGYIIEEDKSNHSVLIEFQI